jgi:hypothetical protein
VQPETEIVVSPGVPDRRISDWAANLPVGRRPRVSKLQKTRESKIELFPVLFFPTRTVNPERFGKWVIVCVRTFVSLMELITVVFVSFLLVETLGRHSIRLLSGAENGTLRVRVVQQWLSGVEAPWACL